MFTRNKEMGVQSFILKLVNNHCAEVDAMREGPRLEGRVCLVTVVRVVPIEKQKLLIKQAFTTVTKEFSTRGVAVVLSAPRGLDEVLLGFRWEEHMKWVLATAKHLNPMGGGFYQLGFRMREIVCVGDYPELDSLIF
jgi:hypothetical protein